MDATIAEITDTLYEMRLETLLSVDDLVAAVMNVLEVCLWLPSNMCTIKLIAHSCAGEGCVKQHIHLLQQ